MSYGRTKDPSKKYYGLYVAEIMDIVDGQGAGRLQVFIADISGGSVAERKNPRNWVMAQYCSPFMGATSIYGLDKKETFEATQTSYGMWMVPPDIGTKVIVGFINGDITNCFWLGSYPQAFSDVMIPGNASGTAHTNAGKSDKITEKVPVAETNRTLDDNPPHAAVQDGQDLDRLRPYSKYVADGLVRQGLVEDPIRGTTTASARRGAPSNVYGISTPGPVVEGEEGKDNAKRKGGSSFIMDDQDGEEKIRLRTRSGSQLILDESNGLVYMVNRDGTAWFEMDAEGNVDVFSSKSITMRSEEDFNIRADRNITMEAGQNIYMKAAKDYGETGKHPKGEEAGTGGDIYIEARNDLLARVKNNTWITNETGNLDVNILTGNITFNSGGTTDIKASGAYQLEASTIAMTSGNLNVESGGNTQVSGTFRSGGALSAGGDVVSSQQSLNALFNHTHGGIQSGPGNTAPFGQGGSTTSASGPGAGTAQEVTKEPLETKKNIEHQDLGLEYDGKNNNIKSAIEKIVGKVRESDITTLLKRWITREPCPEKKRD
jgi:hypothetical protein